MQKFVLGVSARILLAEEDPSATKILAKHHVNYFRSEDSSIRDRKNKHGDNRAFSCYRPTVFVLFLLHLVTTSTEI